MANFEAKFQQMRLINLEKNGSSEQKMLLFKCSADLY